MSVNVIDSNIINEEDGTKFSIDDFKTEQILTEFDKVNENVETAYTVFERTYDTAFERTFISDIVNGETINIKPDNILINKVDMEFDKVNFNKRLSACSKQLYDYQIKAIRQLVQLEQDGYYINPNTGVKVVSNGWILSLPIGSGKSIVFLFLALWYRNVPRHPIIISKSGKHIPIYEQMQFKYYPFYYEDCSYIEKPYNDNIVIIPAYEQNVKDLVEISHDKPFMRVIIDDYTSMPNIDSFRQILASSTIFVSGSGFERSPELIPTSYYTLKYSNVNNISIVGLPEDTYKGVVRNNIAMIKLLGSSCDFSDYNFVQKVDELTQSLYNCTPKQIYPLLSSNSIKDYMGLYFVLVNKDKLRSAINAIDKDYNISGKYKQAKYMSKRDEVKNFIVWIKELSKIKNNKLLEDLLSLPSITVNNNESTPVVQQVCMCCKKTYIEHNGYGVLTTCCGAFYCENCIKNATTHDIANKLTNELYHDEHNYYCSCCRRREPKLIINMSKKKDKSVYAYNIIDMYYKDENDERFNGVIKFDYYFYMLLYGLTPKYHNGTPININNEIKRKIISNNIFNILNDNKVSDKIKEEKLKQIRPIFSLDHLMICSLECINRSLLAVDQQYTYTPYILFYNAPKYMESRIKGYMRDFEKHVANNQEDKKNKLKGNNPITKIQPLFMNSIDGLIGIHLNVVGIVVFNFKDTTKDGVKQLLGRCLRINTFNNKLTFFITPDVVSLN